MAIVEVSRELELATHMSAQEICRELADMDVVAFQCLLGSRGIPVNYGVEDFQADLEMIKRLVADQ